MKIIEPTFEMLKYSDLIKRMAREILHLNINVVFAECNHDIQAEYTNETLYLNLRTVPKEFFESLTLELISFTIHELAFVSNEHLSHFKIATDIGAKLTMFALKNPAYFDMEMSRLS